jgi:hypothetical protein
MRSRAFAALALASLVAACGGAGDIDCTTAADCVQGSIDGICRPSPSSERGWCAFPDPKCPGSAQRWGIKSGDGLAGTCVEDSADAAVPDGGIPDAANGQPAFDVIYADEWKLSYSGPLVGGLIIVNKGAAPLSFETLHVKVLEDDSSIATTLVDLNSHGATIEYSEAIGQMTDVTRPVLAPLIHEPIVDTMTNVMSIEAVEAGNTTYDVHVQLTIELEGVAVEMPMTIHHIAGPVAYVDPVHAIRVHAFR